MSIMKMVREVETVRRMMSDSDSDEDEQRIKTRVNSVSQPPSLSASGGDKLRMISDKLKQFVDEPEEDEAIEVPDKPLKLVQASTTRETTFPNELQVELEDASNGHTARSQGQAAGDTKGKNKRNKGLKLVTTQATFSDELVFDEEPKKRSDSNAAGDKKDLSAFMDEYEEEPVKSVKSKTSKMKLITLDSVHSTSVPSRATTAVQSVTLIDKHDDELFDDIELPSSADLKRRFKNMRPITNINNATTPGALLKRHSNGKIDNNALKDWCEDDDDDDAQPLNTSHGIKNANKRGVNLLTVK